MDRTRVLFERLDKTGRDETTGEVEAKELAMTNTSMLRMYPVSSDTVFVFADEDVCEAEFENEGALRQLLPRSKAD